MRRILVAAALLVVGLALAEQEPSAAQHESWVVFATDDGGIATSHPDGSARRTITTRPTSPLGPTGEPYAHRDPDLSPDGTRVALRSCAVPFNATCEVWTVGFDGSDLRRVPLRAEAHGNITSVTWSPDSQRIAVGRRRMDGGTVVTVADAGGSAERDVAFGEHPDWSPDGDHLAYRAPDGLRVLTLSNGTTRLLTPHGGPPSWSPDGQRIAFNRRVGTPPHIEERYAVIHPDGSGLRLLAQAVTGWTPEWGADSRTLAAPGVVGQPSDTSFLDLAGNVIGHHPATVTGWANPSAPRACTTGYRLAGRDGSLFAFGTSGFHGSLAGARLNAPVAGVAAVPAGDGYWLLGADGGVFTFGPGARFFGSTGGLRLNAPVLAMSVTTSGSGYWLVAGDGGIFTFGDAPFFGSTGSLRLNQPVVALATTPTGRGYWLVARDGGIFTFGDAGFFGSTGDLRLASPIVAMVPTATGQGYWLVAGDGGVFTFGDATFPGSAASPGLGSPVVAAAPSPTGLGFSMATADGQVVAFGDAEFCGSRFGTTRLPDAAIVGLAG